MPIHSYVPFGTSESTSSIDDRIRPSLRQAFPLRDDHAEDHRFQRLLDALARGRDGLDRLGRGAVATLG